MPIQELVCGTCAAVVPHGRLSCPACGEMLAAVAGGRRPAVGAVAPSATPAALYDLHDAPPRSFDDEPIARERATRRPETELPWGMATAFDGSDLRTTSTDGADAPGHGPGVDAIDADPDPFRIGLPDAATRTATVAAGSSNLATPARPFAVASAAPGAYVPPSAVVAMPAGPAAPARAWAGQTSSGAASETQDATRPTRSVSFGEATRVVEFAGWLSVAGGALAAVGFLLPWSEISVIGASGVGYFDRWGMAGPGHVIVVLGLLTILALALIRNPIPVWVRVGLPGVALAALLLGLVWPYMLGLPGAGVGASIVALGAALLGVAGVLALVSDRHAGADRAV